MRLLSLVFNNYVHGWPSIRSLIAPQRHRDCARLLALNFRSISYSGGVRSKQRDVMTTKYIILPKNTVFVNESEETTKQGSSGAGDNSAAASSTSRLTIQLRFDSHEKGPITFSAQRDPLEPWPTAFARLQLKLQQRKWRDNYKKEMRTKKAKPSKMKVEGEMPSDGADLVFVDRLVLVDDRDQVLPEQTPLSDAVRQSGVRLKVGEDVYTFVINPPRVLGLSLRLQPIVGCPLLPSIDLDADCDVDNVMCHWFVSEANARAGQPTLFTFDPDRYHYARTSNKKNKVFEVDGWKCVAVTSADTPFVPEQKHSGHSIKVVCQDTNDVVTMGISAYPSVASGPRRFIWEDRQEKHCREFLQHKKFRIVSYNVLADLYLDLKPQLPQHDLYFPYCPREYQNWTYRYPLLLKELPGYKADIMCLQEVDVRLVSRFLPQVLAKKTEDVTWPWALDYCQKGNVTNEGLAVAFRKDRFKLEATHHVKLSDLLLNPENSDLKDACNGNQDAWTLVSCRNTVLQLCVLKPTDHPEMTILVANTHLYFDPRKEFVKLIQTALALRHIESVNNSYIAQHTAVNVGVVFCGDFNVVPSLSSHQLLTAGRLSATDASETWATGALDGIPLEHHLDLVDTTAALGDSTDVISNYTRHTSSTGQSAGFEGRLDYVFASQDRFGVDHVVPMPDRELIVSEEALPSSICPSDHLPIVCDLHLLHHH